MYFGRQLDLDGDSSLDLGGLVQVMAEELGSGRMCGALIGV